MYLNNLADFQPTGAYVRRKKETGFQIDKCCHYGEKATEWLMWIEQKIGEPIQHMFNSNEHTVGGRQIPVDGYCKLGDGRKIALQYHGCYYHSHLCNSCPKGRFRDRKLDLENQLKTYQIEEYIEGSGYEVISIWECEFERMKRQDPNIREFCKNLNFTVDRRFRLDEDTIISEIRDGKMFGMIQCSLVVPEKFQPIIKHAMLSSDHIGLHMKRFAQDNGLLKSPVKTLLCSYFADKILLATPLLQWLLDWGIEVTEIYQVMQFKPVKCFQKFAESVTSARREADLDPRKQIVSSMSKLTGKCTRTN